MASVKTKLAVGIFVVAGFTLVIMAVLWLGMSNYLEKGTLYVTYFDESVQGLDKDSPVKYRGVSIGRVHSIGVASDANLIEVLLKIETGLPLDKSIVAQLKAVGITGIMFVELEKKKKTDTFVSPKISFPSRHPVIDTKPSEIKVFMGAINDVFLEFKNLDIKGVSEGLLSLMTKMEQTMDEAQIARLSEELHATLGDIQRVLKPGKWEKVIDSMGSAANNLDAFAVDGRGTMNNANTTLGRIDHLLYENDDEIHALILEMRSSLSDINTLLGSGNQLVMQSNEEITTLMAELRKTLKNYEKAGKNLNRFLELVADQPSQLFLGEPPEEKLGGP